MFRDVGATSVICIPELKMQMLAASCHTLGLHTLVTNLLTSNARLDSDLHAPEVWLQEYAHGAGHRSACSQGGTSGPFVVLCVH